MRHVDRLVSVEQVAPVLRQGLAIPQEQAVQPVVQFRVIPPGYQAFDRHDQRWLADDARAPVDLVSELCVRAEAVLVARLGECLVELVAAPLVDQL